MKAIVWHGNQDFELEEVAEPEPDPDQVLVQLEVSAICGSDLHLKDFGAPPPVVPGHEAAGVVIGIGSEVSEVAWGKRITLNPVQYCGRCYN
jgi:threonine dehydrogenase-like Zn-dependent dehydrogenase